MRTINVTEKNGDSLIVFLEHIVAVSTNVYWGDIKQKGANASIYTSNGSRFFVQEDRDAILNQIATYD